jgi:hypothetical protein
MKDATGPAHHPTDTALDGITWLELGEIECRHRMGAPLTEAEQFIRAAALETSCGEGSTRGIILARAALLYQQFCEQQVRRHGGTVVRETHRIRRGRHTVERQVDHFPPKPVEAADPARRSRPRARCWPSQGAGDALERQVWRLWQRRRTIRRTRAASTADMRVLWARHSCRACSAGEVLLDAPRRLRPSAQEAGA